MACQPAPRAARPPRETKAPRSSSGNRRCCRSCRRKNRTRPFLVIDEERGRLLLVEGRKTPPLTPGFLQLHTPSHDLRNRQARAQLVEELGRKAHAGRAKSIRWAAQYSPGRGTHRALGDCPGYPQGAPVLRALNAVLRSDMQQSKMAKSAHEVAPSRSNALQLPIGRKLGRDCRPSRQRGCRHVAMEWDASISPR